MKGGYDLKMLSGCICIEAKEDAFFGARNQGSKSRSKS